jgi:hypothetical protein
MLSTKDNSFRSAQDLGTLSGQVVHKNQLSSADKKDFLTFSLSKSSRVSSVLRGLKSNANLTLFDADRNRIGRSNARGTQTERIRKTLEPGQYYVRVNLASKQRTRYRLKLVARATTSDTGLDTESQQLLNAHNRYRREVGIPDLSWSEELATSAQRWANQLASTGSFQHSNTPFGENLARGTAGFYSGTDLVDLWGNEQQFFRPGRRFPDVSTTGDWTDVGHYTQMVWRTTTEVGCGMATENGSTTLVCQYNPPGNVSGQVPY